MFGVGCGDLPQFRAAIFRFCLRVDEPIFTLFYKKRSNVGTQFFASVLPVAQYVSAVS
jgi:hypothetical protein